ncbi:hypothetical protein N0V83_009092 [Neocucurbitaria cava]|uniref:Uncharacterized protein n=1 Tax=Neocucurbitaria cava TaxID=798079 RepID=A0A9W9CIL6_9PLEO|nr:hypothetical protein N0V83_009092 [Neocucurbitaria cava]
MPAISHLQPRLLEGTSSGISGTAIALIVVLGLIPVIALIWVVFWLLFFYGTGTGRTCWCTRRKRRTAEPEMVEQRGTTDTSQEMQYEKAIYDILDIPQRPYAAHTRTESGSSNVTRLSKTDPARSKFNTRLSMQSVGSASSVPVVQEPKPFV